MIYLCRWCYKKLDAIPMTEGSEIVCPACGAVHVVTADRADATQLGRTLQRFTVIIGYSLELVTNGDEAIRWEAISR